MDGRGGRRARPRLSDASCRKDRGPQRSDARSRRRRGRERAQPVRRAHDRRRSVLGDPGAGDRHRLRGAHPPAGQAGGRRRHAGRPGDADRRRQGDRGAARGRRTRSRRRARGSHRRRQRRAAPGAAPAHRQHGRRGRRAAVELSLDAGQGQGPLPHAQLRDRAGRAGGAGARVPQRRTHHVDEGLPLREAGTGAGFNPDVRHFVDSWEAVLALNPYNLQVAEALQRLGK